MSEWISVKERLPDAAGFHLCCVASYTARDRFFQYVCLYDGRYFWIDGHRTERVTHWMPLPEPPEEERGERG